MTIQSYFIPVLPKKAIEPLFEPSLGWHRVCLNTIIRKGVELDSERLRIIPMGSRVHVVKVNGRRCKIDLPINGWVSRTSSNGETILSPMGPPVDHEHYSPECAGKVVMDIIPVVCDQNDWPEGEEIFKIIIDFLIDPDKSIWNPEVKRCGGSVEVFFMNTTAEDFEDELRAIDRKKNRIQYRISRAHDRREELMAKLTRLASKLDNLHDSKNRLIQNTSVEMNSLASQIKQLRIMECMKKQSM